MRIMYLKNLGLVVSGQVVSEDIGIHEGLSAETESVDGFVEELNLDPWHVV